MRILFITHSRIGDAILSSGVLSHLVDQYRGARVTIACGPAAAELFRAVPGLEEVCVLDRRPCQGHWLALWRRVAARRWDLVVDLRASAIAYFLRARERRIFKPSKAPVHRVVQLARLVSDQRVPAPRLWTAPEHERRAREIVPDGSAPVLAVAPAANWRGKTWRAVRFAELIERLTATGGILPQARVAVLGAASERALAEPALASLPPARRIDLVGGIDLLTAAAVLRRAALFVGNDSGLMHLAAAAGVPTLGLFGPSRPEHYAPWGDHASAVSTPVPYEQLVGGPGYDHRTTDTLMDSLTVDRVESAARALWRRCLGEAA